MATVDDRIRALELQNAALEAQVSAADLADARLQAVIAIFGVFMTLLVIFFALKTEQAAVAAAKGELGQQVARVQALLKQAESGAAQIDDHLKMAAERLLETSTPTGVDRPALEAAARAIVGRSAAHLSADQFEIIIGAAISSSDWVAAYENAIVMRKVYNGPEQDSFARLAEGLALAQQGHSTNAERVYRELIERHRGNRQKQIRRRVARAMVNRGVTLGDLGKLTEETEAYNEALEFIGNTTRDVVLLEQKALALFNRGYGHSQRDQVDDELASYDQLVALFQNRREPQLRAQTARAHYNRACVFSSRGEPTKAVEALQGCKDAGGDVRAEVLTGDSDFDRIRDAPEFKAFASRPEMRSA
jgi:tetratricopeptide (TPR) repeat protein